jgi:hypothetical protein
MKQVVKGFKEALFRGSSSSSRRKELLWRSAHPDLQGRPIAFQRDEVYNNCVLELLVYIDSLNVCNI